MNDGPDPRLQRLLGGESLAELRRRLRRHFERRGPDDPPGAIRLGRLSADEREALASLLGRPPRFANSMLVDIAAIDGALRRAGLASSLRHALEQFEGPIPDRASARAELLGRWSAVADGSRHPGLAAFLRNPAGLGLLKRLSRQDPEQAASFREGADAVLRRLPAQGLPRAQLAAETLGNSHGLDTGEATATLVLAALRRQDGPAGPVSTDGASESKPEERARDVWARAGVLVNELARPALFLNLPRRDGGLFAPGEPGYASLRLLLRAPPAWAVAGKDIHVCENPNLLAIAADHLGSRCAPLVCTDGMPAAAQRTLLTQLVAAKARLLYHGDFDWPGIRIANHVMRGYGARSWRFGTADYQAAVSSVPLREHRLTGAPVSALWDDELAPAMRTRGVAIAEEGLTAFLLQDLVDQDA